jgi:peptide-methionine (R)-S-oxide reductase
MKGMQARRVKDGVVSVLKSPVGSRYRGKSAPQPTTSSVHGPSSSRGNSSMAYEQRMTKNSSEWEELLTAAQFASLRRGQMEEPGSGEFWLFTKEGVFSCAGCGEPLFASSKKLRLSDSDLPAHACFQKHLGGLVRSNKENPCPVHCRGCGGFVGFRTLLRQRDIHRDIQLPSSAGISEQPYFSKQKASYHSGHELSLSMKVRSHSHSSPAMSNVCYTVCSASLVFNKHTNTRFLNSTASPGGLDLCQSPALSRERDRIASKSRETNSSSFVFPASCMGSTSHRYVVGNRTPSSVHYSEASDAKSGLKRTSDSAAASRADSRDKHKPHLLMPSSNDMGILFRPTAVPPSPMAVLNEAEHSQDRDKNVTDATSDDVTSDE